MSYGSPSFRELTPFTHAGMNEEALAKRLRHIVSPPSDKTLKHWHVYSIDVLQDRGVSSSSSSSSGIHSVCNSDGNEDELLQSEQLTINFEASLNSSVLSSTIDYYASVAKDDLPLLACMTAATQSSLRTLSISRRHLAIMQAIGFASYFEMSDTNIQRRTNFKTVPLSPVFMRMLLMTIEDSDCIVDKWRVYGVVRTLLSWIARRLFDKALNVHAMLHDTSRYYFADHYRRLPIVLNIMHEHVRCQEERFIRFLNENVIGYTLLYVFFAPQQVSRIHHRLISEASYIETTVYPNARVLYPDFYALIDELKKWTEYDEFCEQNLIFIPSHDFRWKIDVRELHMQTYRIACDPRIPTNVAMALMLSLVASSRDDGSTVRYLEGLLTPFYMKKRTEDIIKIKQRDRPKEEHPDIARQVYHDVLHTDIYKRDFIDPIVTFKTRIQSVHKWNARLGTHDLHSSEEYAVMLGRTPTLYAHSESICHSRIPTRALELFLNYIDGYYASCDKELNLDARQFGLATDCLLPLSNLNTYLDRAFFCL